MIKEFGSVEEMNRATVTTILEDRVKFASKKEYNLGFIMEGIRLDITKYIAGANDLSIVGPYCLFSYFEEENNEFHIITLDYSGHIDLSILEGGLSKARNSKPGESVRLGNIKKSGMYKYLHCAPGANWSLLVGLEHTVFDAELVSEDSGTILLDIFSLDNNLRPPKVNPQDFFPKAKPGDWQKLPIRTAPFSGFDFEKGDQVDENAPKFLQVAAKQSQVAFQSYVKTLLEMRDHPAELIEQESKELLEITLGKFEIHVQK